MIHTIRIRMLCCEFAIRANCPEIIDALLLLTPRAEQCVPLLGQEAITITWTGNEFLIEGAGADGDFELDLAVTRDAVFGRMFSHAATFLPDHAHIRGVVCGNQGDQAFIIVGPRHSGKTALAVRLALDGLEISGDDHGLIKAEKVLAWPRKFILGEEALTLYPELRERDRFQSSISNPRSEHRVSLDPIELGQAWRITSAALRTIIYIEPGFGRFSMLRRASKQEMMQLMLPHCMPPVSGDGTWLIDVCRTIDRAAGFILHLGDLSAASSAVRRALGGLRGTSAQTNT